MCWVIRRSQYIRSTPNLVTSLFKVGPSKSTSPPEAIKQIRESSFNMTRGGGMKILKLEA